VYMPVINRVLHDLGLTDAIQKYAYLNHDGVVWRNLDGKKLAQLPLGADDSDIFSGVYQIGQARMNGLVLEKIKLCPSVDVKFGCRCVGIDDDPASRTVKVMVHPLGLPDNDVFYEAQYVLAADGAQSAVRRMLCIPFEGYTLSEFKMIGTDVLFDYEKEFGWTSLNFFVDPVDWAVIAYTGQYNSAPGAPKTMRPQWRVAYAEPVDIPEGKEIYDRAEQRMKAYMKDRTDYHIVRAEPYYMHQRCATHARKGRVMLAGDALHSNNPIGGLGLTGGILDAFVYGNAFTRVFKYGEPDALLTDCANSRRNAWLNATSKLALGNLWRLAEAHGPYADARKELFEKLNSDPAFGKSFRAQLDQMIPETFEIKESPRSKI
jgi:2-polyprenyl-6-methoxyphenol hydroxylase-like FAD-dependent oxidoreductase